MSDLMAGSDDRSDNSARDCSEHVIVIDATPFISARRTRKMIMPIIADADAAVPIIGAYMIAFMPTVMTLHHHHRILGMVIMMVHHHIIIIGGMIIAMLILSKSWRKC